MHRGKDVTGLEREMDAINNTVRIDFKTPFWIHSNFGTPPQLLLQLPFAALVKKKGASKVLRTARNTLEFLHSWSFKLLSNSSILILEPKRIVSRSLKEIICVTRVQKSFGIKSEEQQKSYFGKAHCVSTSETEQTSLRWKELLIWSLLGWRSTPRKKIFVIIVI